MARSQNASTIWSAALVNTPENAPPRRPPTPDSSKRRSSSTRVPSSATEALEVPGAFERAERTGHQVQLDPFLGNHDVARREALPDTARVQSQLGDDLPGPRLEHVRFLAPGQKLRIAAEVAHDPVHHRERHGQ